jgi:hypothetical protein
MNKFKITYLSHTNRFNYQFFYFTLIKKLFTRFLYFCLIFLIIKSFSIKCFIKRIFFFSKLQTQITILRSPHADKRSREQYRQELFKSFFLFKTNLNVSYNVSFFNPLNFFLTGTNFFKEGGLRITTVNQYYIQV